MPHRHGPGGLGGGASPIFVRNNSFLEPRARAEGGSWPWIEGILAVAGSGRIRADRSFLLLAPGSHLELMA